MKIILRSYVLVWFCSIYAFGISQEKVESNNFVDKTNTKPRFPGCEEVDSLVDKEKCARERMFEFIYSNLKYPKEALNNGVEGICVLRFDVTKEGKLENIKIVRDIGSGCGRAALSVVNKMNTMNEKWVSGTKEGKPTKVSHSISVKFQLSQQ